MELTEGRITANGVEFAYFEAGSGPLALCLHGFPDSARTWRYLLPALADAGFRGVAPYMRGYAPSAVPSDGRYQAGALAADAVALHDAFGADADAVLIGHDWGATGAYGAAAHAPERWRRVVTAAVPPFAVLLATGFLPYAQMKRSWYMFFFQLPLADAVVAADDLAFIDHLWADWSPGYDAADDLPSVKDALRKPENLSAALGYYRALFDPTLHAPELASEQAATLAPTPQPTLYLHGATDGCMGVELVRGVEAFLGPGSKVEIVDGAGHFLHVEKPDEVNRLIVEHITAA